ncbi:MAG: FAD-dependent oxidoreductase [Phycisphaerales bacterium]|nr:FAD-dependent oxidoreductase [Phycisphaerales bacterium]|tara:strand:- start:614 stop:1600 length:987 start_codon:yes stop_codon:yes gene_type:complete
MIKFDIAVIGAGLAGLTAANSLREAGFSVIVMDKARGPGGRLATRRGEGATRMDHGCQYLTDGTGLGPAFFQDGLDQGCLATWSPALSEPDPVETGPYPSGAFWHVGLPTMSAIPKAMAQGLEVKLACRVAGMRQVGDAWTLFDDSNISIATATWVVSAIPSPQALELFKPHEFSELESMSKAGYDPNWTLMLVEQDTMAGDPDVIRPESGPIAWIVNQRSKPGRPDVNAWVAQATTTWSIDNLELEPGAAIQQMLPAVSKALGRDIHGEATAHRWRYAFVNRTAGKPSLLDARKHLAACGDWCLGAKAGHAIRSGRSVAEGIIQLMG